MQVGVRDVSVYLYLPMRRARKTCCLARSQSPSRAFVLHRTQIIRRFAREVDPEGRRSIGVITKPDNIPEAEHLSHERIINLASNSHSSTAHSMSASRKGFGSAGHTDRLPWSPDTVPYPAVPSAAATANPQQPAAPQQHDSNPGPRSGDALALGYFVVKNPSQERIQASISYEQVGAVGCLVASSG